LKNADRSFKIRFPNLFNTIREAVPTKVRAKSYCHTNFKKRNLKDSENYRGICLLNSGNKTFSRIINSKLEVE